MRVCLRFENCTIDENLPVFDHTDPANDKYTKKSTFVAEGLLQLFANLTYNSLFAYSTVKNGDFFHNIYFCEKYQGTQTQNMDSELFPYNDRTTHTIRAGYLQLLGMRSYIYIINAIITNYYHRRDILNVLGVEAVKILKQLFFFTPFDQYSRDSK